MTTRAMWQATLTIKKYRLAVKLYAAVEDREIHFHLLHKRDRTRVEQQMVDAHTGRPVPLGEALKAFEAEPGLFVKLTPEEIERSSPRAGRDLSISRFISLSAIDPFLYERPYYLSPDAESIADYFALAQALEKNRKAGIAQWVMRKHSYRGALTAYQGYLVLITLKKAAEVIALDQLEPPGGPSATAKEKDLAGKLLEQLSGTFRAGDYHDEYQQRVRELIDAKRSGKTIRRKRPRRRPASKSLADSLEKSLRSIRPARRR
jgi:DNA end-binding protein Ku